MLSTPSLETSSSSIRDAASIAYTISEYREEYLKADRFLQEVQSFVDLAGIPALNELRNAGKHFLAAIDDAGTISSQAELTAAVGHARRASYEAYEAGILAALSMLHKFQIDYPTTTVGDTISEYTETLRKARDAQQAVEAGRSAGFDRTADHTIRMQAFRDLRCCAEQIDAGREEMNKKVDQERSSARTTARGLQYAAWALVLAFLALVWTATNFWTPWGDVPSLMKAKSAPDVISKD